MKDEVKQNSDGTDEVVVEVEGIQVDLEIVQEQKPQANKVEDAVHETDGREAEDLNLTDESIHGPANYSLP